MPKLNISKFEEERFQQAIERLWVVMKFEEDGATRENWDDCAILNMACSRIRRLEDPEWNAEDALERLSTAEDELRPKEIMLTKTKAQFAEFQGAHGIRVPENVDLDDLRKKLDMLKSRTTKHHLKAWYDDIYSKAEENNDD